MTKMNKKVEDLLIKHPNLTQEEAIKIVADKNERKKKKRSEKADRGSAKKIKNDEVAPNPDEA